MKVIVRGKIYDTEKATELWKDKRFNRTYYMTAKGNFFVVYFNAELEPMTEAEMKEVLAKNCPTKYLELWPDDIEEA